MGPGKERFDGVSEAGRQVTGDEDSLASSLRPYVWGCAVLVFAIVIGFVILVIRDFL